MRKFRFLEWKVYKDSQDLFKVILNITKSLPHDFKGSFGDQITRAGLSIILNIAEGSGKTSDKELNRFFEISLGSCYEVLACADTLKSCSLLQTNTYQDMFLKIDNITNQLGGFKKFIKGSS